MPIDLERASSEDATTLANLFQYYIYDMGEFVDVQLAPDGRYVLRPLDAYWTDARRHPHLVRVDGELAGFALVQQRSRITGDEHTWDVAEFFILRKFRRHGVGATVATRLFDSFRGSWEVRELNSNLPAIAFWRRVISAYTNGQFEEAVLDDDRWHGPVQSFRNDATA